MDIFSLHVVMLFFDSDDFSVELDLPISLRPMFDDDMLRELSFLLDLRILWDARVEDGAREKTFVTDER